MNALFVFEAKQLLLGFGRRLHARCRGVLAAFRHAGVVRGLQRVAHGSNADVVEVQAVAVTRLQGIDGKMRLGDAGEEVVGGHGGVPGGGVTTP